MYNPNQQYQQAPQQGYPNQGQQQYVPPAQQYQQPMQQQGYAPQAPAQPQGQQQQNSNILVQGRIVWLVGRTPFEGKPLTDDNGRQIMDENGQPSMEYGFGLAIPKVDPRTGQYTREYQEFMNIVNKEIYALYPSGQTPHDFAKKFKDGDVDVDQNGKPFKEREGYVGHIVVACKTRIPLKFFRFEGGNNILVNDGIKNGDYVNVQLNIKGHPPKGRGKAGLYVNPTAVQLIQAGKEIINAPSGDQLFGQNAPSYSGQVVPPTTPTMPGMGQGPSQNAAMPPQQGYMPQGQPQYQQAPQNAPMQPQQGYAPQGQQPVQPHYDVLPQHMQNQGAQQGMSQHGNQGSMQGNGYPNPSNTGMNAQQPAYPSNGQMPGMPPQQGYTPQGY